MPLSSYGDGIKKVLSIASGIAEAVNGILLIDEVETAIHSRHFDEIFRFIVSACRKFHVQVFITSHSMEAIDGFLSIQDYAASAKEDPVSIVTLKKDMLPAAAMPAFCPAIMSGKTGSNSASRYDYE